MSKKAALEEFWRLGAHILLFGGGDYYCTAWRSIIIIMHAVRWRHEIYTEDDETR